jgi:hypothetical protein
MLTLNAIRKDCRRFAKSAFLLLAFGWPNPVCLAALQSLFRRGACPSLRALIISKGIFENSRRSHSGPTNGKSQLALILAGSRNRRLVRETGRRVFDTNQIQKLSSTPPGSNGSSQNWSVGALRDRRLLSVHPFRMHSRGASGRPIQSFQIETGCDFRVGECYRQAQN